MEDNFPLFRIGGGGGSASDRNALLLQNINNTIPALDTLHGKLKSVQVPVIFERDLLSNPQTRDRAENLSEAFSRHGSDKGIALGALYSILGIQLRPQLIFEIGLGTNNPDFVSNMGKTGVPGASLRGFRDYFAGARVVGADIDHEALFSEERIETHYLDQTSWQSFLALQVKLHAQIGNFDLMIDDGLHSSQTNLLSICFFLGALSKKGAFVIEDISESSQPLWLIVGRLLGSEGWKSFIYSHKGGLCFGAVR